MRNYLFVAIILISATNSLCAQDSTDDFPYDSYAFRAEHSLVKNYDLSLGLIDTLAKKANENNNEFYLGVTSYLNGRVALINSEYDTALYFVQRSKSILENYSDSIHFYKLIVLRGNVYMEQEEHFQALREFKKCIQLLDQKSERDNDFSNDNIMAIRAQCFSKIGIVYGEIGDYEAEKESLKKSLHIALSLKKPWLKSLELSNSMALAYSYYRSDDLDLAEKLALENLSAKEAYGLKYSLGQNFQVLGLIEMKRGKYDLALQYFKTSDEKIKPFKVAKELVRNDFFRAKCYIGLYRLDEALDILLSIQDKVTLFFSEYEMSDYMYEIAQIYNKKGEYEIAIQYLSASNQNLDNETQNNSFVFLNEFIETIDQKEEMIYDSEVQVRLGSIQSQMDKEKSLLEYEYEKQKKNWIYGILGILLLSLIIILTLLYLAFRRNNKKMTSLQELSEEKKVLFQEVHHRVKNNFQVISSMLNLQVNMTEGSKENVAIIESKLRIQSMALVHNLIYRDEEIRNILLKEYVVQLFNIIDNADLNRECSVSLTEEFDNVKCNLDKAVPLGLLFNEIFTLYITNSFVGMALGEISVKFIQEKENDSKGEIIVAHNGVSGIFENRENDVQVDLGIGLIEALSEQLNGDIQLLDKELRIKVDLSEE